MSFVPVDCNGYVRGNHGFMGSQHNMSMLPNLCSPRFLQIVRSANMTGPLSELQASIILNF